MTRTTNKRRFWSFLFVTLAAVGLSGCSFISRVPVYEDVLELRISAPVETVRPGEALIAEVELINQSKEDLQVRQLNGDSISFWWWSDKTTDHRRRHPIYSYKEDLSQITGLPRGKEIARRFLFTTITEEEGTYYLQAIYTTPVKDKRESPMAVSLPLEFKVNGERLFKRGDDGLILKEDVIRIAKDYLGRPTISDSAVLAKNEAGFHDWWVTLTVAPEALAKGERPQKGYFVNPYLGVVRKEAKPNLNLGLDAKDAEATGSLKMSGRI